MTITDRMAAWRQERRVLQRVSRAAWRLEQAERERAWALALARAEGVSIRTLAAAAGLVSARVHQITAGAPCGRDRGDRVGASMVVLQTGGELWWGLQMATSSSPRPGPTSPSTSQRSRGLCASCRLFLGTNDRPVKRLDNGRLSGTSVGECSTACAWRGTSMRRSARPHVWCRQRRLHEHVAASTSGRQPLAWTLAVTQSEHPAGRDNRTFGAADSERPIAASVSRVAARRSPVPGCR